MIALPALIENLQRQLVVYRRLLELSSAQVEALKVQDVRTVHALLQEIEMTMLERSRVDQQRTECIRRVALEMGIPFEEVTASRVAEAASDPELANVLRMASRQLGEIVRQLDAVVEVNRVLLESELRVIDTLVKGMTRNTQPDATYQRGGTQAYGVRIKLLDMQV